MIFSEPELVIPALRVLAEPGNRKSGVTTTELIRRLRLMLRPSGHDIEIIAGRNDDYFSQKVRNLKSHKKLQTLKLATHKNGRFTTTDSGLDYLAEHGDESDGLRNQGFSGNQRRRAAQQDFKSIIIEEGALIETSGKAYARSKKLGDHARKAFADKQGRITCKGCGFEGSVQFGPNGVGLIDIHHLKPMHLRGGKPNSKELKEALAAVIPLCPMLAAHLGQREGDVLRLAWSQYDGTCVSLRQQKTKKPLAVPATTALNRYLDLTPRSSTLMVTSETTGRPYREDNFRHIFAEVRNSVGLSDFQFRDLRRTAAVRLAEAGCTAPEIAAITGHTIETTQRILETYVPRTTPMARNAIAKLERNKRSPKLEG